MDYRVEANQCPNCGGALPRPDDAGHVVCRFCGARMNAAAGAAPPADGELRGLREETARNTSELALRRLSDDLARLRADEERIAGPHERRLGCGLFGGVVLLVVGFTAASRNSGAGGVAIVAGFVLLVLGIRALRDRRLDEVRERIADVERGIAEHRAVVDRPRA